MTHQRYERLSKVLDNRQPNITVVLENVFDPHNVSAVMRTCDAVGIQEVFILNDRIAPHKKWGYRSSSTATEWLTVNQYENAEQCFEHVKNKYKKIFIAHLAENAVGLYEMDFSGSFALVFGNETFGVSEHLLKYADGNFLIPQVGVIKSLNISVACAVTLYEAFRQKKEKGHYENSSLESETRNDLEIRWGMK